MPPSIQGGVSGGAWEAGGVCGRRGSFLAQVPDVPVHALEGSNRGGGTTKGSTHRREQQGQLCTSAAPTVWRGLLSVLLLAVWSAGAARGSMALVIPMYPSSNPAGKHTHCPVWVVRVREREMKWGVRGHLMSSLYL